MPKQVELAGKVSIQTASYFHVASLSRLGMHLRLMMAYACAHHDSSSYCRLHHSILNGMQGNIHMEIASAFINALQPPIARDSGTSAPVHEHDAAVRWTVHHGHL